MLKNRSFEYEQGEIFEEQYLITRAAVRFKGVPVND